MTLAVTKTTVSLFRRSFGFAQDDRLVCQFDQNTVVSTKTLSSRPKHCRLDQNTVIPTAVEGSHDVGSILDFWFSIQEILRLRSG